MRTRGSYISEKKLREREREREKEREREREIALLPGILIIRLGVGLLNWSILFVECTRRELYGNFYHTECGNLISYGHSGDFRHSCLCFYYAFGKIRHTEYGNNSHSIGFHTV